MAHTNDGYIYIDTSVTPNIGVSIGDVQSVVGLSSNYLGRLVTDGDINPAAKYKPLVSTKRGLLTVDERRAMRYGFSEANYFYPNALTVPPYWPYNKPTVGQPNNWFRVRDFEGYDALAAAPIGLQLTELNIRSAFGALVWKDSYINNYLQMIGVANRWYDDRSLSIDEILNSGTNHYDQYYIGFCFYRYNTAETALEAVNLVVTNKKFGGISGVEIFMFHPEGDGTQSGDYIEDGIHYPIIPILNNEAYIGSKYLVALCLSSTGPSQPLSYAYEVLPDNYSCLPLGFDPNKRWDLVEITANSSSAISGLTGTLNSGITLTKVAGPDASGFEEYAFSGPLTCTIETPVGWTGTSVVVQVEAFSPYGMFYYGTAQAGGYDSGDISVSASGSGQTLTRQLVASLPHVWIYKDGDKTVTFNAIFKQAGNTKQFSNALIVTTS